MSGAISVACFARPASFHCARRPFSSQRSTRKLRAAPSYDFDTVPSFELEALEAEESIDGRECYQVFDALLGDSECMVVPGQKIEGTIMDSDTSGVYVDFGAKELGFCPTAYLHLTKVSRPGELMPIDSKRAFEVLAVNKKSKYQGGSITVLSRQNIIKSLLFKRFKVINEMQVKFQMQVEKKNRGGYVVIDDYGFQGFLPGRQAIVNPSLSGIEDDPLLGTTITVNILDFIEEDQRLVVTQRTAMGSIEDSSKFAIGSVLEGVVEGIMPYGVFVSVDGPAGLLHITQISHTPVDDIESMFQVNEKIKVMVLSYDKLRGRLSLSTKKLEPNPGDMLQNRALVYDKAEEMAEKFKQDIEMVEAKSHDGGELLDIMPSINVR